MRNFLFLLLPLLSIFILPATFVRADDGKGVGNGGDWLTSKFIRSAHEMVNRLRENSQTRLVIDDPKKMDELIDTMTIEIVDGPLLLNGVPKDAINFFPEEKKIQIQRARWETYFKENRDTMDLIYHELLPYFIGNDEGYRISRAQSFKKNVPVTLANSKDGDFSMELRDDFPCAYHIKFQPPFVSIQWFQNPKAQTKCNTWENLAFAKDTFVCADDSGQNCVGQKVPFGTGSADSHFAKVSDDAVKIWWEFTNPDQSKQPKLEWTYVRIDKSVSQLPVNQFRQYSFLSAEKELSYGENCALAAKNGMHVLEDKCKAAPEHYNSCVPVQIKQSTHQNTPGVSCSMDIVVEGRHLSNATYGVDSDDSNQGTVIPAY